MNDKYYTPEIEEFHVGFEFEISVLNDNATKHIWIGQTFKGEETRTYFTEELEKKDIRVKYLDREDIESLGFKMPMPEGEGLPNFYINYDLSCSMMFSNNKDVLCRLDMLNSKHKMKTSYIGKIKNKSELKRLLKQLGI